jgi:hypothetical protein
MEKKKNAVKGETHGVTHGHCIRTMVPLTLKDEKKKMSQWMCMRR